MTLAVTAQGDKFEINTGTADSPVWVQLKEMKAAPAIGTTSSPLDATSLDDVCKVNIEGLNDYGTLEFTFNAIPANAPGSNIAVLKSLADGQKYDVRYTVANLSTVILMPASSVNFQIGAAAVDSVRELIVQLTLTNAPQITIN